MIRKKLIAMVAVIAMAAMIQTAQASITLGQLVSSGGTLGVGDKTFSGFGWTVTGDNANVINTLNTEAGALNVSASIIGGVYFLDFGGLLRVDNTGGGANLFGDLLLTYTVSVNSGLPLINAIDQSFTANAPSGDGRIVIGESVISTDASGHSTLSSFNPVDFADLGPTTQEINDILAINPYAISLTVSKDILLRANPDSIVAMSDVKQSFHQVPEPTTMIAGALLLLPFGASTLRILRKNRKA